MSAEARPRHPEAEANEVLIGNVWRSDFQHVGWHTKRMGKIAYKISGKPIPASQRFCPVFVRRAEIEAAGIEVPASGPTDHRW